MNHERYDITISFTVCCGMKDKALEDVRKLLEMPLKILEHVSDIKTIVTHKEI